MVIFTKANVKQNVASMYDPILYAIGEDVWTSGVGVALFKNLASSGRKDRVVLLVDLPASYVGFVLAVCVDDAWRGSWRNARSCKAMRVGFLDREAVGSRKGRKTNDIRTVMTCLKLETHYLSGIEEPARSIVIMDSRNLGTGGCW